MEHDQSTRVWRSSGGRHAAGHTRAPLAGRCILAGLLVLLAMAFGPAGGLVGPALAQGQIINISEGQRVGKVVVSVGKSETLRVSEPFENVVVGNPEIADVAPLTDESLYLLGRTVGTTNLAVYNAERELIAVIDVEVTLDTGAMREALSAALPGQPIQIRSVGGRIMLQGVVADAVMVDRAMGIARGFAGGAGEEGADDEGVINALSVASPQQVTLEVRVIEAQRTLGKDLGINWQAISNGFAFSTFPATATLVSGNLPFAALLSSFSVGNTDIDVLIQALEAKGVARRLAEPNLTALSGQPASFHAGGEFPVPVLEEDTVGEGDNQESILVRSVTFKPFGVRLNFTPTVLADGVINLLIEPEVSEPNFANSVGGIPSLSTRRARTTVELRDGQSMAMAGLLQTTNSRNIEQIPWLGDLPVLGALFRSQGFQKEETELVVIVTPRLVLPVPPGIELATPLDNLDSSNDPELVLFGQLEVTKEQLHLIETGGNVRGPFGHMLDLPEGPRHVVTK